jgi:DNA ligase (NAD+)
MYRNKLISYPFVCLRYNSTVAAQIKKLKKCVVAADKSYYSAGLSNLTDQRYDNIKLQLIELEKEYPQLRTPDSPSIHVSSEYSSKQSAFEKNNQSNPNKILHSTPMLSLQHVNSIAAVLSWFQSTKKTLQSFSSTPSGPLVELLLEPKFDGMAVDLKYNSQGKAISAATRGDGETGDIITPNVQLLVDHVPTHINLAEIPNFPQNFSGSIHVRGEILMTKASYAEFKANSASQTLAAAISVKTARNLAVGLLRRDLNRITTQELKALPRLQFKPYSLHFSGEDSIAAALLPQLSTHEKRVALLKKWRFSPPEVQLFSQNTETTFIEKAIIEWNSSLRIAFPYEIDGLVLKINDISQQIALGSSPIAPLHSLAYKFPSEIAQTKLISVDFSVGKTGKITPTANLAPVQCGGIIIRRATLFNCNFLSNLGLYEGCTVQIQRSNDVIPIIVGRIDTEQQQKEGERHNSVLIPSNCPCCGEKLVDRGETFCENSHCSGRNEAKILNYAAKNALNIENVGESLLATLNKLGIITKLADFIEIAADPARQAEISVLLLRENGVKERKIANFLRNLVDSHRAASEERLLVALQLGIGTENSKKIMRKCRNLGLNLLQLAKNSEAEQILAEVRGIGPDSAQKIAQELRKTENIEILEKILKFQLQNQGENSKTVPDRASGGKLAGEVIVITGSHAIPREKLSNYLESHSATVDSSITRRTTMLLLSAEQREALQRYERGELSAAEGEGQINRKLLAAASKHSSIKLKTLEELEQLLNASAASP